MKKKNLTVEDVKARVKEIKETAKTDFERAHGLEESLHQDVLKAISKGKYADPEVLAKEALKSLKIDFVRACA